MTHANRWDPLGVRPDAHGGAHVALRAQGATRAFICLFDENGAERQIELVERVFNVFNGHIPDFAVGTRYGFRVHGDWNPDIGHRWNSNKLLIDPYAKAIDGELHLNFAVNGHVGQDDLAFSIEDSAPYVPKSVLVDTSFDWENDQHPDTAWGDTVIYEAHVKGLTKTHPSVPEHLQGTYAGIAHPAIIEHLHACGVTAIELLPTHHFVDEFHLMELGLTNYWGYNSIGFFAPHAGYSSSGTRGQQVTEFKQMVKDLHASGIELILDVVYNHTAEGNEFGPTLSFRGIDNDNYYHLNDKGRSYADHTGTGNTLNLSNPNALQLVMDSLRYWVTEMHVDGFRFDLASALARSMHDVDMLGTFMSTLQQDPILRRVKLIAEPWDVGPGGYQVGEFPPLWTEWNDKYRDCLRDWWRGSKGIKEVGWRLTGSADLYGAEGRRPFASINFLTAHDGFTMRDLVTYERKHNLANGEDDRDGTDNNRSRNYGIEGETDDPEINRLRERQLRNMFATLAFSTGVPMITAGDEFGRTQYGNNNAYCQDNEISWVNWDLSQKQWDLLSFNQRAMQLRHKYRAFRQRHHFDGKPLREGGPKDLAWISPDGQDMPNEAWNDDSRRTLGMFITGELPKVTHEPGLRDASFLLIMHAGESLQDFVLPGSPYAETYVVELDSSLGLELPKNQELQAGTTVAMTPYSLLLLRVTSNA